MADNDEPEPTPAQDIVVTKYKMSGDMVNGKVKSVGLSLYSGTFWTNQLNALVRNKSLGMVAADQHVLCVYCTTFSKKRTPMFLIVKSNYVLRSLYTK